MSRKQNIQANNTRKQQAIQRYNYLRDWVTSTQDLTVDDLFKYDALCDKLDLVQILIKGVPDNHNFLVILRTLAEKEYLPKITQKTKETRYSLYNIAAYIKSCDAEIFKELIEIISLFGYNIFEQNNKGENAFMAIMADNNTMSIQEKQFRYMVMAQISPKQIKRLVVSCFNKLNSENKITMDRLRYALCINPQQFIKVIAGLIISKKCPDSCIIHDMNIYQYVKMIIETFKNCDADIYNNVPVSDKSLELFFKCNRNRLMKANDLFKLLWSTLCTIATNPDNNENKIFNIQSLAIAIGGFAQYGVMLEQCRIFILECLKTENSKFDIPHEERPKIVIRTLIHARRISPEIITALRKFPIDDGFTKMTIERLANPKDSIYTVKIKANQNRISNLNVESLIFFEGIAQNNIDEVLDDTIYILEKTLKEYPDNKKEIIGRLMYCLFNEINEPRNVRIIISFLMKGIDKNDILKNKTYIEADIIPSIDRQNCDIIWKEVIGCLAKK